MKQFFAGKWGKVAIVAVFLCIGAILGSVFPSDQKKNIDAQPSSDTETMQDVTQPDTEAPTKGTTGNSTESPTEDATEAPINNTVFEVPPYQEGWDEYLHAPKGFYVFVYNAESEYDLPGQPMDRSSMVTGYLYSFDCYAGKTCLITDQPVSCFMKTSEYIYYVLKNEATMVYRTDHTGADKAVVYESTYGNVTDLRYYGSDANGKLIMAEEQNRIISYDIPTGGIVVLMEAYLIGQFYYSPYSVMLDHVVQHISSEELGPTIYWKGKLHESDPDKPGGDTYYYFVNTGENWDVFTWNPVK